MASTTLFLLFGVLGIIVSSGVLVDAIILPGESKPVRNPGESKPVRNPDADVIDDNTAIDDIIGEYTDGRDFGIANAGQFPSLVSLQVTNWDKDFYHLCGAILVSRTWALTAAHCLDSERAEELVIVTGADIVHPEQKIPVASFIQHADYTYYKTPYLNDVGLIRLKRPAQIYEFLEVADLATETAAAGSTCYEVGWGAVQSGSAGSEYARFAKVALMEEADCTASYSSTVGTKSLCVGEDGIGSCVGDNGGPLVCKVGGKDVVAGIMSWRENCNLAGKPAIYMDVSKYKDWIDRTIGL